MTEISEWPYISCRFLHVASFLYISRFVLIDLENKRFCPLTVMRAGI
jgi:hypothetical protein